MTELEKLCIDWLAAKNAERSANQKRVEVEEKIIAITGKKDEGSKTHEVDGFKINVAGKLNRKMDWEEWQRIRGNIPETLWPVKTRMELDDVGVKYLQNNEPDYYDMLPITVTPAKASVSVEVKA